ncbi:ribbon-helix-helix protein, CopG family [Paraburkholderia strydomiana]|uniref:ribbon-helix-helix protein, CopG family n=1 Tax=Paraburkholderia strydomiana TaxID=1245417 RepID=UPI0038BDE1FD
MSLATEETIRIQAAVTKDLNRRIRLLAANTDVSVPDIMRAAISAYVARAEAERAAAEK